MRPQPSPGGQPPLEPISSVDPSPVALSREGPFDASCEPGDTECGTTGAGAWRVTRVGLVWALTAHYGLPGCLADYCRQLEKTTRQPEEDPSIFAIALENIGGKSFLRYG